MSNATQGLQFDVDRIREDMALRGWNMTDLARAADVSVMTVLLFLRGDRRTAKTAKKIAIAMGYTVRRYLVRDDAVA